MYRCSPQPPRNVRSTSNSWYSQHYKTGHRVFNKFAHLRQGVVVWPLELRNEECWVCPIRGTVPMNTSLVLLCQDQVPSINGGSPYKAQDREGLLPCTSVCLSVGAALCSETWPPFILHPPCCCNGCGANTMEATEVLAYLSISTLEVDAQFSCNYMSFQSWSNVIEGWLTDCTSWETLASPTGKKTILGTTFSPNMSVSLTWKHISYAPAIEYHHSFLHQIHNTPTSFA